MFDDKHDVAVSRFIINGAVLLLIVLFGMQLFAWVQDFFAL